MDETLFWTKMAALGQIAGAVATFAAVLVSLWIAQSERRAHVRVVAGLRVVMSTPAMDVVSVLITNHGLRPVRVSAVGWRTGWFRYGPKWLAFQQAVQQFDHPISMISAVQPPFDLGPGQDANLHIPVAPFQEQADLREDFFNRCLPFRNKPTRTQICVEVHLVAAKKTVARVEKRLAKFLASGVIAGGAARLDALRQAGS
jgi:hypothetical protein